jgi:hypothetical protein
MIFFKKKNENYDKIIMVKNIAQIITFITTLNMRIISPLLIAVFTP